MASLDGFFLKPREISAMPRLNVLNESLTELEARVGERCIRVHRNALVARRAMKALQRRVDGEDEEGGETWAVQIMPTQVWLAVSRRQVTAVREAMGDCH